MYLTVKLIGHLNVPDAKVPGTCLNGKPILAFSSPSDLCFNKKAHKVQTMNHELQVHNVKTGVGKKALRFLGLDACNYLQTELHCRALVTFNGFKAIMKLF